MAGFVGVVAVTASLDDCSSSVDIGFSVAGPDKPCVKAESRMEEGVDFDGTLIWGL